MIKSVAIIVLNWNNPDDTLACLRTVTMLDYPALTTIVVDNGSTDDSVARIRAAHPTVDLIETGENLGYAEGNNVGIRHALETHTDYVLILNNDTELQSDFLSQLVAEAESDPSIGVVGPKMYFFEPSDMVFAAGSLIEWDKGSLNQRGMRQRESESGSLYSDCPEDVDFIIGCGVLIKRAALEQIGLLDARYYLNFEDVDICVRTRQAGYRVRYTSRAILRHKVSASLGQGSPRNTYYMTRNALLFFGTHLNGWRRWLILIRIVMRNFGHIAAWTIKPQHRHSARNKRDANILALRDAILGRFGKMGPDVEAICRRV
jgi:GT2 family glycosyltransferase